MHQQFKIKLLSHTCRASNVRMLALLEFRAREFGFIIQRSNAEGLGYGFRQSN
jgi:hypothetical protein